MRHTHSIFLIYVFCLCASTHGIFTLLFFYVRHGKLLFPAPQRLWRNNGNLLRRVLWHKGVRTTLFLWLSPLPLLFIVCVAVLQFSALNCNKNKRGYALKWKENTNKLKKRVCVMDVVFDWSTARCEAFSCNMRAITISRVKMNTDTRTETKMSVLLRKYSSSLRRKESWYKVTQIHYTKPSNLCNIKSKRLTTI